jgi:beta-galactosidase
MPPAARANDSMFAPQPAAQGAINFDGRGFLINRQRVFIVSAGMEYARVPQALWADRLMRFKRAGFNCTEFYTFWNYHEPQSGQFDFSGNRDLDAYLKLAKSLGLYAVARVGPYYCAEWDSGGYPVWLRSVPNLQVRTNNAAFEQQVSRFWGHLLPIIAANQINRGGNVILVQLENELSTGWGTEGLGDPYYQFLQSTALGDGLEVPYFFSGLNHSSDPAGTNSWSSAARKNPWFSTEFWCDWYDKYGETAAEASAKDWDTWKIIAYGGNGYNYYMAHGGTDFDYFNNDEDSSSYDYGSAVGQAGDLRPEYYKFHHRLCQRRHQHGHRRHRPPGGGGNHFISGQLRNVGPADPGQYQRRRLSADRIIDRQSQRNHAGGHRLSGDSGRHTECGTHPHPGHHPASQHHDDGYLWSGRITSRALLQRTGGHDDFSRRSGVEPRRNQSDAPDGLSRQRRVQL